MAPIRDWTGAITISPLPYCEIAAGWRWGICCGKGATALSFKDKNDCPLCGVQSYPFLNERVWGKGQKSLCDMVVEWEKVCNFAVSIWCCAY